MRALTADPSVSLVDEPDNEGQTVSAIWAKRRLGRYPVLMDDVEDERYRHLWDWATRGAPSTRRLVAAGWLLNSVPHAARARYYQGRWSPRMRVAGMLGAHPVSYTHLDVYKRQHVEVVHAAHPRHTGHRLRQVTEVDVGGGRFEEDGDARPVSYTHLDVYKRQRSTRPRSTARHHGCSRCWTTGWTA